MSNDQWDKDQRAAQSNNDQGEAPQQAGSGGWEQGGDTAGSQGWGQPPQQPGVQPQSSAQEWSTGAQQQPSAGEWSTGAQQQPSADEWSTGAQQQGSASEWQGHGQQWNPQGQPGGPAGQQWNQNPQGGFPPGQQFQQQPPKKPTGLSNLFDLSFTRFVLPSGAGVIFAIVAIGFLVNWLFSLIWTLAYGPDFFGLLQGLLGELAVTVVYILLARAFLEGMSALVTTSQKNKDTDTDAS